MGLFAKDQQADASAPVTREEFEALRRELAAHRRVAAIAFAVIEEASRHDNVPGGDGSALARLGKIAARPDFQNMSEAEQDQLREHRAEIEEAIRGESQREYAENQERASARARPPSFWNPDGSYARDIPGGSRR